MNHRFSCTLLIIGSILYTSCAHKEESGSHTPNPTPSTPAAKDATITVNIDKSPLDMSYYPDEYPKLKMAGNTKEPLVARVIYSRPKKEGRVIFGSVLKYGTRWRLGANEATEIEFFRDVRIQNTLIKKNRYIIYCIPYEDKWMIMLNTDLFTWGLKIDSSKDVYRFEVPVQKAQYPMEYFTMGFEKKDSGINLVMTWDTVKTMLPIDY